MLMRSGHSQMGELTGGQHLSNTPPMSCKGVLRRKDQPIHSCPLKYMVKFISEPYYLWHLIIATGKREGT